MTSDSRYGELHRQRPDYGGSDGGHHVEFLLAAVAAAQSRTLVDFGCGKGAAVRRLENLGLQVAGYDPNVPEFADVPDGRFDLLYSFDVLEHIPMSEIDEVLKMCVRLSDTALLIPHLGLANTILPNGENAHCTILTPSEWTDVISRYYSHVSAVKHVSRNHVVILASQQQQSHLVAALEAMQAAILSAAHPTGLKSRLRLARDLLFSPAMGRAVGRAVRRRVPFGSSAG